MAINLQKGAKAAVAFERLLVGVGWDPIEGGEECDIDVVAFMLGQNQKLPQDEFFVYYNNPLSADGSLVHSGDDRSGGLSNRGDDETMTIELTRVRRDIADILFYVVIQDAEARRQSFGMVRNAFLRLVDLQTKQEIARYRLDEEFVMDTCVKFGRLVRRGAEWEFIASGEGSRSSLEQVISRYC